MRLNDIHPELQKSGKRFPSLPLHNYLFVMFCKLLHRFVPIPDAGPGIVIESCKLQHAAVRVYRPQGTTSGAAVLWIHGGGLVIGRYEDDRICGALARDLNLIVVSVHYRLAPTHKYPCAISDCLEAWQWLQNEAIYLGVDPSRMAVAGQSAGGGLAANLVQWLFDLGGTQPAAQVLFSPMLDDRTALRHELDGIGHWMWNNRNNRRGWAWYLGAPAGYPELPPYSAAARRMNLAGLPPAWMSVSDIELFYDEDRDYAMRLEKCGVPCHLHITPRAPHCFDVIVPESDLAREMYMSAYQFLRQSLKLNATPNTYSYGHKKVAIEQSK